MKRMFSLIKSTMWIVIVIIAIKYEIYKSYPGSISTGSMYTCRERESEHLISS